MRKIILLIIIIISSISSANAQGWFQQNSGTSFSLNSVYFLNANTGYIAADSNGNPRVLKTTNGGTSWSIQYLPNTIIYSAFFIDENTGYVGGGMAGSAAIYKTTNGGLNWTQTFPSPIQYVYSLFFFNASTGIAVTGAYSVSGGFIFRTTNGGVNWTGITSFGNALYSVYFVDVNTGYSCGAPGLVIKSTNGGLNWIQQPSGTSTTLRSIYFINSLTGWTAGTDSRLYKTTNGGSTWSMFYNQSLCGLYSVRFANEQTGWVCGCEGAINGTTNGGSNWILQSFATTLYLYSMSFVSPTTGWAVGTFGRILKTTTGGFTGIQPISNEIPAEYKLYQNYPNPFNPSTKIRFSIPPLEGVRGRKLIIYDILGREVTSLVNEQLKPGSYEVEWNASDYSSGFYYYRLTTEDYSETKGMVLVK